MGLQCGIAIAIYPQVASGPLLVCRVAVLTVKLTTAPIAAGKGVPQARRR